MENVFYFFEYLSGASVAWGDFCFAAEGYCDYRHINVTALQKFFHFLDVVFVKHCYLTSVALVINAAGGESWAVTHFFQVAQKI